MFKNMYKIFLLTALLLLFIPGANAAEEVKVGTYIINVGEYEIDKGSYTIDFYLWFYWEGNLSPTDFEFMNGRADYVDVQIDEPGYKFYRIQAKLYEDAHLKDYPLDRQALSIKIEDKIYTTDELVYVPDMIESGISPEFSILGWELEGSGIYITEQDYPEWNETYSRYVRSLIISRPISSILKVIIPIIFIALTAWFCFFLPLHKLSERLVLSGTALLSAVAFHIYITASLPNVGYMTLADELALSLYALLVLTIIGFIRVESYVNRNDMGVAVRVNRRFSFISLVSAFVMFFALSFI